MTVHENSGADSFSDRDEDEIPMPLCSAAIALALRGQVGVVLHHDPAFKLAGKHRAQRHIAPTLQGTELNNDSIFDVDNGWNAHNHSQELIFWLLLFSQQFPH